MQRILVTITSFQDLPGPYQKQLNDTGWELDLRRGPLSKETLLGLEPNLTGIICGEEPFTPEVIDHFCPTLKVLSKSGVGLDNIDLDYAKQVGLTVTSTPGVNHVSVAEHALGLLLAHTKRIDSYAANTKQGKWNRQFGFEIAGKSIGIVGAGRVGQQLATIAKAVGMTPYGYDPHISKWPESLEKVDSLETLFNASDIICLCCLLTPETTGFINESMLSKMKPGTILMNISRGALVDSVAVKNALGDKHLGAFLADVLDVEPPPQDHPLLNAPNTIITPHIASRTLEAYQRQVGTAVQNVIDALSTPLVKHV